MPPCTPSAGRPSYGRSVSDEQRGKVVSAVLAGAAAELAAHVLGVGWLASPLQPALQLAFTTIGEADRRMYLQVARALDVAIDETDGGAPEVERLALADPARTELFRRVVEASGRSTLEEKISALGRVLAAGLPDGGAVDEALMLAAALGDMEAAHVRTLATIAIDSSSAPPLQYPDTGRTGWAMAQLAQQNPGIGITLRPVLAVLQSHGLIHDLTLGQVTYGGVGQQRFGVTEIGQRCLDLLGTMTSE